VHRVVAAAIQRGAADKAGKESVTDSESIRGFLRGLRDKSDLAPLFGTGPVADAVTDLVWLEVEKLKLELKLKLKRAMTRAMMGNDASNEASNEASTDVMGKFDGAIQLSFFGLATSSLVAWGASSASPALRCTPAWRRSIFKATSQRIRL